MRFLAFIFSFFVLLSGLAAQSTTTIKLTQLERGSAAGKVGVTRSSDGKQRYIDYVNVADACITFTPTATGNTTFKNHFVQKCATDSVWYIDLDGRSQFFGRNAAGAIVTDGTSITGDGTGGNTIKANGVTTANAGDVFTADGSGGADFQPLEVTTAGPVDGTGTAVDPVTLADGNNVGEVWTWDGAAWVLDIPGGGVAEPAQQIVYGTGPAVDSDTLLRKNYTNGGTITTHNNKDNQPALIQFKENLSALNYATLEKISVYNFAKRAVTDTKYARFGDWASYLTWDNSINVAGGDTTGNMILNEGFNFRGVAGWNPKRPTAYWSREQGYLPPGSNKMLTEIHYEMWDTLGRSFRPITAAYEYDGSTGGISFVSDTRRYITGPSDGGAGNSWEFANFRTGTEDKYYRSNTRIHSSSTNYSIIEKKSQYTSGFKNVLGSVSGNAVSVGDSAGIRATNRMHFSVNNSATGAPELISSVGDLWLDSTLLTINSVNASGIQLGMRIPSSADLFYQHYDGNYWFLSRNNASFPVFIHKTAPTYSFFVNSAGKVGINNNGPGVGTLDIIQRSDDFLGGLGIRNTVNGYRSFYLSTSNDLYLTETANTRYKWGTGGEFQAYGKITAGESSYTTSAGINYVLNLISGANDFQVAPLGLNPNTNLVGNVGDIANNVATGELYGKFSGTGTNTGWGKFLNLIDPNSAATNNVLKWNGSAWAPGTDAGVTEAESGTKITSGRVRLGGFAKENILVTGQNNTYSFTLDSLSAADIKTNVGGTRTDVIHLNGSTAGYSTIDRTASGYATRFEHNGEEASIVSDKTSTTEIAVVTASKDGSNDPVAALRVVDQSANISQLQLSETALTANRPTTITTSGTSTVTLAVTNTQSQLSVIPKANQTDVEGSDTLALKAVKQMRIQSYANTAGGVTEAREAALFISPDGSAGLHTGAVASPNSNTTADKGSIYLQSSSTIAGRAWVKGTSGTNTGWELLKTESRAGRVQDVGASGHTAADTDLKGIYAFSGNGVTLTLPDPATLAAGVEISFEDNRTSGASNTIDSGAGAAEFFTSGSGAAVASFTVTFNTSGKLRVCDYGGTLYWRVIQEN